MLKWERFPWRFDSLESKFFSFFDISSEDQGWLLVVLPNPTQTENRVSIASGKDIIRRLKSATTTNGRRLGTSMRSAERSWNT
jgi:hypothetical protein